MAGFRRDSSEYFSREGAKNDCRSALARDMQAVDSWIKLMKVRDIMKKLEADGWHLHATRGSHRQYKHPVKAGRVTVPGKPGDELAPGTLNSIFKQARWK